MLDYVTYKYVRLRDARLGALYYILALLILIYSLVEIFVRKGYMQVRQLLTATQARLSYGGYGQRVWPSKTMLTSLQVLCQLCHPYHPYIV